MSTKKNKINKEPSVINNDKQPEDALEQVDFYGTYNVQRTSVSDTTYPEIAHGLPEKEAERLKKEANRWKNESKK